ncbi:MAG TPA: MarR family transcriptional regulator [Solirubrobacterales bacterium]|nr:MarR family transcriptional regulator [Solirubrobacterales bacterium]
MRAAQTTTDLPASAAQLRLAITRTARRLRQEAAGDLSPSATAALATAERHGPLTPSELADLERVSRPSATRSIGCLAERGLVARTPDPADGRSALVAVTPAGRDALRRLRGRKNAYLSKRMRRLADEDVETLSRAADILERLLDEDGLRGERG